MSYHVLLINPRPGYLREPSANEPLNLLTLAAQLLQDPYIQVNILDGAITPITLSSLLSIIKTSQITHVGCTSTTAQYPGALTILTWIKAIAKKLHRPIPVILGGVQATILGKKALKHGWNTVCTLEGDLKITPIIKNNLTGLVVGDRIEGKDLNAAPFPARHLINPYHYHKQGHQPVITIMTMRGCPYNCLFCDKTIMGYRPRCRSPRNIVAEIKTVINQWGIKDVIFYDDTFTVFKSRVIELCRLLKPLKISWECNSRVNTISPELLTVMKQAGCWCIRYGLESANPRVLTSIRKRITVDMAKKVVKFTQAAGINAGVYAMFGFPEDNWDSAQDLVNFINEVNPNRLQLSLALPLPNTDLYTQEINDLHQKPPKDLAQFHYAGINGPHTWIKKTKYLKPTEFKRATRWLQNQISQWQLKTNLNYNG